MKKLVLTGTAALLTAMTVSTIQAASVATEDVTNAIQVVRSVYNCDRQAFVGETMQLTEAEGAEFWPLYKKYQAEREKLGDELVKLVLEYADAYPNVPEDRARQLLNGYTSLEEKLAEQRVSYMKKFAKVLPPSKALRFAQVENRLDLALRLRLASGIPLSPTEGRLTGSTTGSAVLTEGVPGGVAIETHELTATVTAIDLPKRHVTLMSEDGIKQTVKVSDGAINFDQIRVGDELKARVTEELVVYVAGEGEPAGDAAAQLIALAPKGAKPAGIVAEATQVTANVTALDVENHRATLQFEDGTRRTVAARPDVDLSKRKVGDKVVIRMTEAVALTISPAKAR